MIANPAVRNREGVSLFIGLRGINGTLTARRLAGFAIISGR